MRFETSLLIWDPVDENFSYDISTSNTACGDGINIDWVVPLRGSIVLVFSTTPVRGASQCVIDDLVMAGFIALEKVATIKYSFDSRNSVCVKIAFKCGVKKRLHDKLYWWPEIVS